MLKSTSSDSTNALKYIKQLDGLRAIAVMGVVLSHYVPQDYWLMHFGLGRLGTWGVRLFFVLSGFLITGILLKGRQAVTQGQQNPLFILRQFYIRRFLRIFPLYYATLGLTALISIPLIRETLGWHLFYLSNVYFAIQGTFLPKVEHFWSLAVEEQFYLFWPWLILFLPKRSLLPTLIIVICFAPLFRMLSIILGFNQIATWVLTPSLLDALGMGSLLAYLTYHKYDTHLSKFLRFCLFFGLPMMLVMESLIHVDAKNFIASICNGTAIALVFTYVIAGATSGFKGFIGKILECRAMVYLGKISYGIYLVHPLIMTLTKFHVLPKLGLADSQNTTSALIVCSTVVTLIVATISWQCFEKPINNLKKFFPYTNKHPQSSVI